jgi:hypothetical protein
MGMEACGHPAGGGRPSLGVREISSGEKRVQPKNSGNKN